MQQELLSSWTNASKFLGNEEYYPDFLAYFQGKIDSQGYESVVNEYLLQGDEAANDLLLRLHSSVLHPLLQFMYGLEWKQPAIVAEALAQACVHGTGGLEELLLESESRASRGMAPLSEQTPLNIYQKLHDDPQFSQAAQFADKSKVRDGILKRSKNELLDVLQTIHFQPDELHERTAEMFHDIIYVASGAALRLPKHVKYDFFLV